MQKQRRAKDGAPGTRRYGFVGNTGHESITGKNRIDEVRKGTAVSITLEQSESASVLQLEGVIDISSAGELKGQLLKALEAGQPVSVSLGSATELDVTAVQLLWAAERKARGAGVSYSIAEAPPEPVLAALSEVGLQQFIIAANAE